MARRRRKLHPGNSPAGKTTSKDRHAHTMFMHVLRTLALAASASAFLGRPSYSVAKPLHSTTAAPAPAPELSALVSNLKPSATIAVHALTLELRAAGEEVVSLCVGEPDFAPPKAILDAVGAAAAAGETRYTAVAGTPELKSAIAADLQARKGVRYAPGEIVVANGAKQAVYETLLALCGPGDDVIIPAPYWVSYPSMVDMVGATATVVPTTLASGYKLTAEALKASLSDRTKAVILCNPSNPTGSVLDEREQRALLDVLDAHEASTGTRVWVIADEIYERLDYGEEKHVSFAALGATAFDRTVTINGFSKAFAMTGFRLGYLAAPAPVAAACAKIQGQITSCASSLAQAAGVAALGLAPDALDADVEVFRGRRDRVLKDLGEIAAAKGRVAVPPAPGGAFYVFFDVSGCLGLRAPDGAKIATSTQFCESLLAHRKLALVPGDAFGDGAGCRLSYAASDEELAAAMAALGAFVNEDLS